MKNDIVKPKRKRNLGKTLFIYGGLAWPIIHFIVFWFCMNIGMVYNSFFTETINGELNFVGFEQYLDVFRFMFGIKEAGMLSPRSWLNTLSLMGLALFINLPLTLFFSYLIYKKVAGHAVLRVGMYVPCVLSTVILCLFYKISVSGTQTYKSLFTILEKLGYSNRFVIENGALADSRTAWKAILIFSVWAGVNGNIIYFTSSMARLPDSVLESAELDGASEMRQFISIVIPMIWPVITTMSITLISGALGWYTPSLLMVGESMAGTTGTGSLDDNKQRNGRKPRRVSRRARSRRRRSRRNVGSRVQEPYGKSVQRGGILMKNTSVPIHRKSVTKRTGIDKVFRIIGIIIMSLLSLSYVYMYLWLLLNSFRTSGNFIIDSFKLFDFGNFTLDNYKTLFTVQIAGSSRNPVYLHDTIITTVVLVVGQVALAITIPAFTAYIIAKYEFKLKNIIYNVSIVSFIIPTVGSIATTYRLMMKLHLLNTYFGIFLMAAGGFGLGFLLFKNFFAAIPWEYAESAFLDGATDLGVFLKIMYPQAVPILTAIAITAFIGCWNDYNTAYVFMPNRPTISLGVSQLYTKMEGKLLLPVAFAGMTVLATVSLIVFTIFNKLIMSNFSAGGLKG